MSQNQARRLQQAGIKAGSAIINQAPQILETVQGSIPSEDLEHANLLLRVMHGFDQATAEHAETVGTLAMLLAHRAGLGTDVAATCLLAGRVHDIGKLAISRSLLQKPASPSQFEWSELKLHPVYGSSTLSGLPRLKHLAPIVIAHHEHFDGTGYPNGIAGAEIPIESQIIAIADAFCAMTEPRPYCAIRLPGEAIAELGRCAGTQFNPDLVGAFADMFGSPGVVAV